MKKIILLVSLALLFVCSSGNQQLVQIIPQNISRVYKISWEELEDNITPIYTEIDYIDVYTLCDILNNKDSYYESNLVCYCAYFEDILIVTNKCKITIELDIDFNNISIEYENKNIVKSLTSEAILKLKKLLHE